MWLICVFLNRGPPRFEGERRFGGDRDGYRGGPRGGPGGDFGGDKGGAPADYRPSFGVILLPLHLLCFCLMFSVIWMNLIGYILIYSLPPVRINVYSLVWISLTLSFLP